MGMRSGGGGPLTVKDMREAIAGLPDDVEFMFGSTMAGDELVFYRFKWRDQKQKLLQIELNELSPEEVRSLQRDDECMAALEALLHSKSELTPASVDVRLRQRPSQYGTLIRWSAIDPQS
ncbi:MAG TPA: hypothetical protein VN838_15700 [Bradyrhizobium sp.]|nr:hypothetical protein [Bradyrhizobium sp.]